MKTELSTFQAERQEMAIPADFIEKTASVSAEGILLLLNFYQLMNTQDEASLILAAFTLLDSMPNVLQGQRAEKALSELLAGGLLLEYAEASAPDRRYLLPAEKTGYETLLALQSEQISLRDLSLAQALPTTRPNIYCLYEKNIGPLTPLIVEMLKDDAEEYSSEWLEEAMREAVAHNVRSWSYVRAVLKAWKEKGRKAADEQNVERSDEFRNLYGKQKQSETGGRK